MSTIRKKNGSEQKKGKLFRGGCTKENKSPTSALLCLGFLLQAVSKTGGHLGSSLGVIELTVALHSVFEAPEDKITWDVSHQVICVSMFCQSVFVVFSFDYVGVLCLSVMAFKRGREYALIVLLMKRSEEHRGNTLVSAPTGKCFGDFCK